jgi:hypothetical protein
MYRMPFLKSENPGGYAAVNPSSRERPFSVPLGVQRGMLDWQSRTIAETMIGEIMKRIALIALLSLVTTGAYASCKSDAADKKLAGAAMTSFMKKCETDAKKSCDTSSAEKKLAGAAKTSFNKKCVTDAVGN